MKHVTDKHGFNPNNIITEQKGNVTGSGTFDTVTLTGTPTKDSMFIQNISLSVQNGRTGRISNVTLPENQGYNPTIFLGDFTGNKTKDVLVQIDSGGSGAMTFDYIYSFSSKVNKEPQLLFNSDEYNNSYSYKVSYENYYLVNAESEHNKKLYIIDIAYKDKSYLKEIYHPNGTLKEPISGFVNPLSSLFPVDVDRDGIYELMAFQKIAGRFNADSLGYFENILKWEDSKFVLNLQYLGIFGGTY